jgi:hypothetical protein
MKTLINSLFVAFVFGTTAQAQIQTGPFAVTYNAQNPICHDESNGLIEIFVDGGTGPYSFLWNDGSTAQFKSHIPAGIYEVSVTDINNETVDLSIELINPMLMEIGGSITSVSSTGGNNGSIDVTLLGTAGSFTYEWTTISGSGINPTALDQLSLTAGSYTLTVTNATGCEVSRTFIVMQPTPYINTLNANVNTFIPHGGGLAVQSVAYPNPSNGVVNFKSTEDISSIAIYDMNGFLVKTIDNSNESADLKAGNYTAVFTLATGVTNNEHIIVR